jgi:hypothetical protein
MATTVVLPDELIERLRRTARLRRVPLDALVVDLLSEAISDQDDRRAYWLLDDVVARIRETPRNPAGYQPPLAALSEVTVTVDPSFDLEIWTRQWQQVETELDALDRQDDVTQGRQ